jgi:hypothetical protein
MLDPLTGRPFEPETIGLTLSRQADRCAEYLSHGRRLAHFSDGELSGLWLQVIAQRADRPEAIDLVDRCDEIEAEALARGLGLPWRAAAPFHERIEAHVLAKMEKIRHDDPTLYDRISEEREREIEKYRAKMSRKN